jgi:NAD-dependent dihydropyrimidine dehydrogenase PreA subunit
MPPVAIIALACLAQILTLANTAEAIFVIDDNECTRCAICVERCPSDALWLGRVEGT